MSRAAEFLERVHERVLVSDGAMGTMIYAKGIFINRSFDELNLSQPAMIKEIHQAYAHAGADIIETNTFGATRFNLERHGLSDRLAEINRAGAKLARESAGAEALVAGSVGPLAVYLEPLGRVSFEEARAAFREQVIALAEGGVDLLMLETFTHLPELREAILAAREVGLPIVAQITIDDEAHALDGTPAAEAARRMEEWGAEVIGINCSDGPQTVLEGLTAMAPATQRPLVAQPNAGKPRNVEGRNLYMVSPEYLADYARQFIAAGAKIVGGCCGTTPEHIKWIRNYVRSTAPGKRRVQVQTSAQPGTTEGVPEPMAERSKLAGKIAAGKFVTLLEILPPRGSNPTKELDSAVFMRDHGVDAINIPDGPRANARMSNQALAVMMSRLGVEPVLHYCCRDRNVISMQSDLLGAYALGIRNLILITGDPPKLGNYPDATAVFDVDAIGLTNLVHNLNRGLDLGGNAVGGRTGFLIGVGANPGAVNYEEELRRYRYKVEAGADYVVTQPVFDVGLIERFVEETRSHERPLIAGIWPLASFRQAEFMQNELRVSVPAAVMERMRACTDAESARKEGLEIAKEMVVGLKPRIAGVQISVLGRNQAAVELLKAAGAPLGENSLKYKAEI